MEEKEETSNVVAMSSNRLKEEEDKLEISNQKDINIWKEPNHQEENQNIKRTIESSDNSSINPKVASEEKSTASTDEHNKQI